MGVGDVDWNARSAWEPAMAGRSEPSADALSLVAVLGRSEGGGSGSFPAQGSDGDRWYVKPLNNNHSQRVCVNEYVVSAIGRLLGAPVCEVDIIRVPDDLAGYEFTPGKALAAGYASASRAVGQVREDRSLTFRHRDDNRRRHVGVFALYDWCAGNDAQWLYNAADDERTFSHDHGHYFPGGPDWSIGSLESSVDVAYQAPGDTTDLDRDEIERMADALEAIDAESVLRVMRRIPSAWPVSSEELGALAWFLYRRRAPVAARLRAL